MMRRLKTPVDHSKWHLWFAWHPVKTEDNFLVWLQYVYRRIEFHYAGEDYFYCTYKPTETSNGNLSEM